MKIVPIIYVPAAAPYAPTQADLDVAHRLAHDASIVFARKIGGSAAVAETVMVNGPSIDLTADLNQPSQDGAWAIVRNATPACVPDVVLAFAYGRASDASGRGAQADGTVGVSAFSPPPVQGGLALLGWNNIVSAQRGLARDLTQPYERANYRLDYGIPLGQAVHEIGHACGLQHPAVMQQGDTIMGYRYAEFASGRQGVMPQLNPLLFTSAERAVLAAHPLFAHVVWTPMPGMEGIDLVDAPLLIAGTYPAAHALVLGKTLYEYGAPS